MNLLFWCLRQSLCTLSLSLGFIHVKKHTILKQCGDVFLFICISLSIYILNTQNTIERRVQWNFNTLVVDVRGLLKWKLWYWDFQSLRIFLNKTVHVCVRVCMLLVVLVLVLVLVCISVPWYISLLELGFLVLLFYCSAFTCSLTHKLSLFGGCWCWCCCSCYRWSKIIRIVCNVRALVWFWLQMLNKCACCRCVLEGVCVCALR